MTDTPPDILRLRSDPQRSETIGGSAPRSVEGASALLINAALLALYTILSLVLQFTVLDRWGWTPFAALACLVAGSGLPLVIAFSVFAVATQLSVLPFWPWSVEQLPTHLRATGQSIGSAGGKLGIFVGVLIFSPGVIGAMGWQAYFTFVGCIFLALVVLVVVFGKETKGTILKV